MTEAPTPGSLGNIGPGGVARRRKMAFVLVAITVAGVIAIDAFDLPWWWRMYGIGTTCIAALLWLQASAKT